jgi:ABC-2 type transport system ATP-binding protein
MDEPTRSLDPMIANDLRTFIRETLVEGLGRTVVLVTHRLEEAEELCDRVGIINRGRLIACGPVLEIKQRFPVRQRYRLDVQHLPFKALAELEGITGVVELQWTTGNPHSLSLDLLLADEKETLPSVIRSIVTQGGDIQHCRAQGVSLEEAFIHLVRDDQNDL